MTFHACRAIGGGLLCGIDDLMRVGTLALPLLVPAGMIAITLVIFFGRPGREDCRAVQEATPAAPVPPPPPRGPGYHVAEIERGEFGEISKIREEAAELADAEAQGVRLMALLELSDLYGAIQGYLERHHPAVSVWDLGGSGDFVDPGLREVSGIYRNVRGYLSSRHPDTTVEDLRTMSEVTQRAFRSGRRG